MAPVLRRASILSVKTSLVAVGCGVLLLGAVSAHAGESLHGTILQGVQGYGGVTSNGQSAQVRRSLCL